MAQKTPNNIPPRLVLYGTTPELILRAQKYAREQFGLEALAVDGYSEFPREFLSGADPIILLVGRGSPKQEIWIESQLPIFEKRGNMIIFGVGGLFDFWAGLEVRAPNIIRELGGEWLWRLLGNPKKNLKKAATSLLFFWYILFGIGG